MQWNTLLALERMMLMQEKKKKKEYADHYVSYGPFCSSKNKRIV